MDVDTVQKDGEVKWNLHPMMISVLPSDEELLPLSLEYCKHFLGLIGVQVCK